jgi:broad specificity phosphatase PhoE
MTLLAMLRHAETHWSLEKRIQGRSDIPLCDEGRQALERRSVPAEWRRAQVFSSPLNRCLETAAALGLADVTPDARLAEMAWGAWEGARLADLRLSDGEEMRANEALGLDFTPPGGESPRHVYQRVRELLAEIARQGQPALAISHRGVIRSVFANATGWDMRGKPPFKFNWSALHVFELDTEGNPGVHRLNIEMPPRIAGVLPA